MPATSELHIQRLPDGSLTAALRAYGRGVTVLAPPQAITINPAALLALSDSPDDYGAVLANRVFPGPLREAWAKVRGQAEAEGGGVHLRVLLDDPTGALHALRWELLRDPLTSAPLARQEGGSLARLIPSDSLHDPAPPAKPDLRALIAVAGPTDAARYGLAPVDVSGEAARARQALGAIPADVLADGPRRATLATIRDGLRGGTHLLYLIAHGRQTPQGTALYLVGDDGTAAPIMGADLEAAIRALDARDLPLLAVLVACEGGSQEDAPLASVGPLLAQAGVPAVIAMQAKISMGAAAALTSRLLRELARDGRIDRALAAARNELGAEWWVPVLWLRSRDGRLWDAAQERPRSREEQQERRNRDSLLALVRAFWVAGVLHESLHQRVRIELGMQTVPDALHQPWSHLVYRPGQQPRPLAPGTPIRAVFADARGQLLILGAPGGGKTTTLLMLAEQLIAEAQADPSLPIPVVFQLSTWVLGRPRLADWLVTELKERYKVPPKLGRAWVESGAILPLLDGLDEVGPSDAERAACVRAINSYLGDAGAPAVVCSRSAEYAQLGAKLQLETAIAIQPLEPAQADAYLARFGPALAGLRAAVATDATLGALADSPLLLSVMALAYANTPAAELVGQGQAAATRRLWADYVERRLRLERADAKRTNPEQLRAWLTWLARGMQAHGQQVFYIEYLQPSWLGSKGQHWLFQCLSFLGIGIIGGLAFGLFSGLAFGLFFGLFSGMAGDIDSVLGGSLSVGLIASLFIGLGGSLGGITLTETLSWDWRRALGRERFRSRMRSSLAFGSFNGLFFGLLSGLAGIYGGNLDLGLILGLGGVLVFGLIFGLGGLVFGLVFDAIEGGEIHISTRPNEGIRRSMASTWRGGLVFGLTFGFSGGLVFGLIIGVIGMASNNLVIGLAFGLIFGLTAGLIFGLGGSIGIGLLRYGGAAVIKHVILRLLLRFRCHAPWDFAAALDQAVSRTLMTRVGGGYRFYHRLLQEHFAAHEAPELPVAAILGPQRDAERGGVRARG